MKDKFPNVWVPRVGVLEAELAPRHATLEGEYTIRKFKKNGDIVQEVGPFSNLITNIGLDRIGGADVGLIFDKVFVGSGTSTPSVADTTLATYVAQSGGISWNDAVVRGGAPDYWVAGSTIASFGLGVAAGNLTEVGIGWGTGSVGHQCFSRALIVDASNNPITITVLPDEYLQVTYTLRSYPNLAASTQSVNLSGTSYTFTNLTLGAAVVSRVGRYGVRAETSNNPVACTGTAAGTPPSLQSDQTLTLLANRGAFSYLSSIVSAYVASSLEREVTISAALGAGNLTWGIRGLEFSLSGTYVSPIHGKWQSTISPAIPKDNTKVLAFGVKVSWDRR